MNDDIYDIYVTLLSGGQIKVDGGGCFVVLPHSVQIDGMFICGWVGLSQTTESILNKYYTGLKNE